MRSLLLSWWWTIQDIADPEGASERSIRRLDASLARIAKAYDAMAPSLDEATARFAPSPPHPPAETRAKQENR